MIHRSSAKKYLMFHAGLLLLLLLFPLYRALASYVTQFVTGCMIHDYLFIYCPLCGGTRAMDALLHLDVVAALRFNPLVVVLTALAIAFDTVALIRLLKGETRLWIFPDWGWIVLVALMIAYTVLRNYLMIAHGYDPVGDLGAFWQGVRK